LKHIAVAFITVSASLSCSTQTSKIENELAALSVAGIRYTTDGCGGSDTLERPAVKDFLADGRIRVIRILICHLSDPTLTNSLVNGKSRVSLGYVSFDLLCHILKPTRWFDEESGDCGLWTRVRADYAIPMLITEENVHVALAAQRRWQELFDAGELVVE